MQKKSFTELLNQVGAEKHNSDLLNLAHSINAINQTRRQLNKLEAEINTMVAAIENGDEFDVEEVRNLYNRAHGQPVSIRR